MKFHIITLFLLMLSVSVLAQEYKESELPSKVLATFKTNFSPSGKASWTKKTDVYVATFKEDGQDVVATFSADGVLSETKYAIPYKELPGAIATYITNNFIEAKVKSSFQRQTPTEPIHYFIVLKKEGTTSLAELSFDMKGKLIKKNVPDDFNKSTGIVDVKIGPEVHAPRAVCDSFGVKVPGGSLSYWETDSVNYTAVFTKDEMNGKAEFTPAGVWVSTRYTVADNELPGPITTDVKANYKEYKIKKAEMVSDPSSAKEYYYLYAKMDGIGVPSVELFYSLNGKFIKKITSEEKTITKETDDAIKENKKEDSKEVTNSQEVISKKELPSKAITYIKQLYRDYDIKEVLLNTSDAGSFYYVKLKKQGVKDPVELQFDINGKFIEPTE